MREKLILTGIIIVVCSVGTYFSGQRQTYAYKKASIPKIDPSVLYRVVKTLDGDTFEVSIGKKIVKVRMLGVDTPETLDPRKPVQCYGKEASLRTKEMLEGALTYLEPDSSQPYTDKYLRILAYVTLDSGISMNEYLLKNGFAREYTYDKPYKRQKSFKDLEKNAQEQKIGLWGLACLDK